MKINKLCDFVGRAGRKLDQYSSYKPVPLNLKNLIEFGNNAPASKSFEFLRNELPVRIANIVQELRLLPPNLLRTTALRRVSNMYEETFETLLKYENCDVTRLPAISDFTDDLRGIVDRHSNVVAFMALGIKEAKQDADLSADDEKQLHYFLDRFYINRIGIRMLINQHILLYGPLLHENRSNVGSIDPSCSPLQLAISAYGHARFLCAQVYGQAPGCDMFVYDQMSKNKGLQISATVDPDGIPSSSRHLFPKKPSCAGLHVEGRDFTFCYLPGHLFHVLFELMKNAMRAVTEAKPPSSELPRLKVIVCNAQEDVTIKLSDKGGGMSRRVAEQAFKYTFTTASHLSLPVEHASLKSVVPADLQNEDFDEDPEGVHFSPLAGRGHGLSLSRLYTRYLSGDLQLITVEGHGTSALVYMKRLPEDANEVLPVFNQTSRAFYQDRNRDQDWISGSACNRL
ncbi:unnamed protein product [Calicophoron daubneyi]|uniref:Protein-serine/threonine kinase n=1 Tax=Calicophoron daubneyi TaxID=300641 RepID=A0AAV2T8X4_CALDB